MKCRPYHDEYDYHRIREFLRSTLLLHDRRQVNWPLYRWDYWRWHVNANIFRFRLRDVVFLWETDEDGLAGVLNPDRPGEAFLQVHPRWRTPPLVDEMLALAEDKYPAPGAGGMTRLHVWAHETDNVLKMALARRGYTRTGEAEYQRWQALRGHIAGAPLCEGYILRGLGGESELPTRSWASWRAFDPDEPDEAYEGCEWYRNVQRIPLYRNDLDLVVVAPDGGIAAFTTVWYDDATKTGAFEPVGVQPEHRRKGLARALLVEGLSRLRGLGAALAYVSSYAEPAHAVYESAGFREYDLSEMWAKTW